MQAARAAEAAKAAAAVARSQPEGSIGAAAQAVAALVLQAAEKHLTTTPYESPGVETGAPSATLVWKCRVPALKITCIQSSCLPSRLLVCERLTWPLICPHLASVPNWSQLLSRGR